MLYYDFFIRKPGLLPSCPIIKITISLHITIILTMALMYFYISAYTIIQVLTSIRQNREDSISLPRLPLAQGCAAQAQPAGTAKRDGTHSEGSGAFTWPGVQTALSACVTHGAKLAEHIQVKTYKWEGILEELVSAEVFLLPLYAIFIRFVLLQSTRK